MSYLTLYMITVFLPAINAVCVLLGILGILALGLVGVFIFVVDYDGDFCCSHEPDNFNGKISSFKKSLKIFLPISLSLIVIGYFIPAEKDIWKMIVIHKVTINEALINTSKDAINATDAYLKDIIKKLNKREGEK